jgi:hypothetical protein
MPREHERSLCAHNKPQHRNVSTSSSQIRIPPHPQSRNPLPPSPQPLPAPAPPPRALPPLLRLHIAATTVTPAPENKTSGGNEVEPSFPTVTPHPPSSSPLSSMSFWADACNSALNRPLQTLLDSAYASCGVTVRCAAAACCALLACIARGW